MNMRTSEWWQPAGKSRPAGGHDIAVPDQPSSKLPFWALVAFTLILILAPQDHIPALKPLHLALVTAVMAGAMYLYDRFQYGVRSTTRTPEFTWALALALWAIVTVPFSLWPGGSVNEITNVFLKSLIIFWLLGHVINTPARLKIIAWTLSLSSVFLSLSAVKSFFSGGFQNEELSHGLDRITGYQGALTSNPNVPGHDTLSYFAVDDRACLLHAASHPAHCPVRRISAQRDRGHGDLFTGRFPHAGNNPARLCGLSLEAR